MVGGSVAFDTTDVLTGLIGVNDTDVDEEALDSDLIVKLVAQTEKAMGDGFLET